MTMTEEAKRTVETLRYCEKSGARCGECPNGFNDKGVPNCHSMNAIADLIESLSAELEQTENKLSELLYYVTGGRFSKTDYSTDDMRRFVDDYNQSVCSECEELEEIKQERDGLSIMLTAAESAAETYKRERDALLQSLRGDCGICAHWQECVENNFIRDRNYNSCWQWRGVKEE